MTQTFTYVYLKSILWNKIYCHLIGELDLIRIFRVGSGYTSIAWQVTFRSFGLTQPTSKTDFFGGAEIEDYI